ncbi:MAG TPA: hypothetical protein VFK73_08955 [Paludibacter sp.]|nr:hypothetical protein [Paludibacter sp.]
MEDFIEYQRFSTLEDAELLIDLLEVNRIPFKIDDSAMRFDMAATSINPLESGIVIQVREIDKDNVDKLNQRSTETPMNDHYMYSLSDNDIIGAVVNPEDWTKEEQILAQEIFKQRNLKPTAEIIKSSRKEKIETEKKEQVKQKGLILIGASWFLWIGILSALNLIAVIIHQNLQFVVGLGINNFILGMMDGIRRATGFNLILLGYALTFLVSGLFIFIWKKSKQENKAIYLTGLIIYGLDTVIFMFSKEWFSIGFHVFALLMLGNGYNALIAKKRELNI